MLYGNINNYPKPIKVYGYTDRSNIRYISGQRKMLGIVTDGPMMEGTLPDSSGIVPTGAIEDVKEKAIEMTKKPIVMAGAGAVLGLVVGRFFGKSKKQKNTMSLIAGGLGGVGGYVYSSKVAAK